MPYSRGDALILKEKIIEKLNGDAEKRTLLKASLAELSQISDSTPKDIGGEEIPTPQLEAKWGKTKKKAEDLLL